MRKHYEVSDAVMAENELRFMLHSNELRLDGLSDGAQMLVDSDHLSFIYLLDGPDEYVYIAIPNKFWGHLSDSLEQKSSVFLTNGDNSLELKSIHQELDYLIQNISGNANYGDEMEKAVEHAFGQTR